MACFPEFLRNSARNTTGLRLKIPPVFVKKSSIILFILKHFSDFAATIPKTFTARYNPYTQRIELLDTKTQILRNMRGKIIKKYKYLIFFSKIWNCLGVGREIRSLTEAMTTLEQWIDDYIVDYVLYLLLHFYVITY